MTSNSGEELKARIEQAVAQLVQLGIPEARARQIVQNILTMPPTNEEMAEALAEVIRRRTRGQS
jgi:Holliday junction resolvasome RuvABC DNA-binding subunit